MNKNTIKQKTKTVAQLAVLCGVLVTPFVALDIYQKNQRKSEIARRTELIQTAENLRKEGKYSELERVLSNYSMLRAHDGLYSIYDATRP